MPWAFRLDPLSGMMILVVTGIGLLIHVYSTAYMHDEPRGGYARFFCYLNLFCFFMLVLVLGSTFLTMFVGWEGVGLCSYLLIGYWYEKKSASDAGKKAFIVNRIGDWGFVLGVFLVFYTFGTLDFRAVANAAAAMPVETQFGVISLICLLLFIGATGKSAQIPLYVWLPDAMEGPTPVSALIHAATMVTAGVYMVGRNAVLFGHAPIVAQIVMIVGALTALMAATIGLVQYDIKRVLAYSTVSQLGYMFLAMGVGAYATAHGWTHIGLAAFAAGAFHLMTHAFFKALLFLGSGSVIHAMAGEQDMRKMGDLKRYMPVTYMTMMIGTLAIAGIFPLSGFFSKDEILFRAFLTNKIIWIFGVVTALMTAFYMFRLMSMTFFGDYRGRRGSTRAAHAAWRTHACTARRQRVRRDAWPADAWLHDDAARTRPRAVARAARIAAGHDAAADGAGRRRDRGGFREHSARARRRRHARAFSRAKLHGAAMPRRRERRGSRPRGRTRRGGSEPPRRSGARRAAHLPCRRAGLDGVLRDDRGDRHRGRVSVLRRQSGNRGSPERAVCGRAQPALQQVLRRRALRRHVRQRHHEELRSACGASIAASSTAPSTGTGWLTVFASWISSLLDRYVVDGAVNLVGRSSEESSFVFRRVQTGLVQNYALLMLAGVCAFVSIYLLVR